MIGSFSSHVRHNAVAYVALFVALGGTSYAAATLPANSVGTKQLRSEAVTSAKIKDGAIKPADLSRAARTATPGSAGPKGDTGAAGLKGDTGPKGDAGANATALWAVVGFDGALARGSHVTSVQGSGGFYEVTFDRNVSNCAFVAGKGGIDTEGAFGLVSASRQNGNVNGVHVVTYNTAASPTAGPFHLAVFC